MALDLMGEKAAAKLLDEDKIMSEVRIMFHEFLEFASNHKITITLEPKEEKSNDGR